MKKIFLSIFMAILSSSVHASGLGWYVWSLDWKKYSGDKVAIDYAVQKCITARDEDWKWCGEREMAARFIGSREQKATSIEKYDVKNIGPLNFEYFAISLFREAYIIQSRKNPYTYFGLFKSGRTEWKNQWTGCNADPEMTWDCLNSYVLLKPEELSEFKKEVHGLIEKKSSSQYEYFLDDLKVMKLVLDTAIEQNKALFFYAMD